MWPLGDYQRLVSDIKHRGNQDEPITFGILIADYDQQRSREYILNYIDRFNYTSDKDIDFYLPGYLEDRANDREKLITITRDNGIKKYFFDRKMYEDFITKLANDFSIPFPYNPELILLEYDHGHFKNSKKIIIELDKNGKRIEEAGELFDKIFEIARKKKRLNEFSNELQKRVLKDGVSHKIVSLIDNKPLTTVYETCQEIKKFHITKK